MGRVPAPGGAGSGRCARTAVRELGRSGLYEPIPQEYFQPARNRARQAALPLPGLQETMSENDDWSDNTIPFPVGRTMMAALGRQLVDFYKGLVTEELPERHLALLQRFDELTGAQAAPDTPSEAPADGVQRPSGAKTV